MYQLVLSHRNYSSWSLRAWLFLKANGIPFDEIRIPLFSDPNWKEELEKYTPAGRVPVLIVDETLSIWDSMAIMEFLLESASSTASAAGLPVGWPDPQDTAARAMARSVSYEMHSGFMAVRDELPQNIRSRTSLDLQKLSPACRGAIARIDEIWKSCLDKYGGPWLFGETFTIADIMYCPVALRFVTYGIEVSSESKAFVEAVKAHPLVQEWIRAAEMEPETLDFVDSLVSAKDSPLTLG